MQLLFKQRLFSWFDSYDIYNESGGTVFTVKGRLAWGHCLKIYISWNGITAVIDVSNPQDALCALMLVLAIDAEKCSRD